MVGWTTLALWDRFGIIFRARAFRTLDMVLVPPFSSGVAGLPDTSFSPGDLPPLNDLRLPGLCRVGDNEVRRRLPSWCELMRGTPPLAGDLAPVAPGRLADLAMDARLGLLFLLLVLLLVLSWSEPWLPRSELDLATPLRTPLARCFRGCRLELVICMQERISIASSASIWSSLPWFLESINSDRPEEGMLRLGLEDDMAAAASTAFRDCCIVPIPLLPRRGWK